MMVEILASVLGGSFVGGFELPAGERGQYINVGHFFLAIDPSAFGEEDHDFSGYLDVLTDYLRATLPAPHAASVRRRACHASRWRAKAATMHACDSSSTESRAKNSSRSARSSSPTQPATV